MKNQLKCKRCEKTFTVHKFAIDPVYATYCKPCIKLALKAYAKLSAKEVIRMEYKSFQA